jgi:hypothetical protein
METPNATTTAGADLVRTMAESVQAGYMRLAFSLMMFRSSKGRSLAGSQYDQMLISSSAAQHLNARRRIEISSQNCRRVFNVKSSGKRNASSPRCSSLGDCSARGST